MKLDFLDEFKDTYMHTDAGRGVVLAGIALGMLAKMQAGNGGAIDSAPIFKQLNFGKLTMRDIRRHLARMPELARVYQANANISGMIESICAKAGQYLLISEEKELGVNGNFAFSVAFLNAADYFYGNIFKKKEEA